MLSQESPWRVGRSKEVKCVYPAFAVLPRPSPLLPLAPSKAALLLFSRDIGLGLYIYMVSPNLPRPTRDRLLTQASPLCSRALRPVSAMCSLDTPSVLPYAPSVPPLLPLYSLVLSSCSPLLLTARSCSPHFAPLISKIDMI